MVDRDGKGLLGRPVRDYRHGKPQTADAPWPSANAKACLEGAQQGAIYFTVDAVWGLSKLKLDESAAELLQTTTRRGIFRPRVVDMGPQQSPGMFRSFMGSIFNKIR